MPGPVRRPARLHRFGGALRESRRYSESYELPYIGFDFLRARADLIDYMKSIGFLFGGASL